MVAMLSLKQSMRKHVFNVFLGAMLVTLGQCSYKKVHLTKNVGNVFLFLHLSITVWIGLTILQIQ